MRVLVTRPAEDAPAFMAALEQRGHTAIWSPALTMVLVPGPSIALARYQAVAITSANAVRALAAQTQDRHTKLICVGPASATTAREMGFTTVLESRGEGVVGLEAAIRESIRPANGPVLYPSAAEVSGNLEAQLVAAGYRVDRQIVYRMDPAESLALDAQQALQHGRLDVVTYFSVRSVDAICRAAAAASLTGAIGDVVALGLSPAVAAIASQTHQRTLSASSATEHAMLQAIDRLHVSGL